MFNCCTNGLLPDLTDFQGLEINAVYTFKKPDSDETFCEALFGVASGVVTIESCLEPGFDENEVFYSVYARDQDGYAEALHDEKSLEAIKSIAAVIELKYPHLTTIIN